MKATKSLVIPRRFRQESGSYIVEMAFVMPLYLMLVIGFTSACFLLFIYCQETYACRAAVRYASMHCSSSSAPCANGQPCTTTDIQNLVVYFAPAVHGNNVAVSPACDGTIPVGTPVTVNATIYYPVGLPFITRSSITLSSAATNYALH